MRQADPLIEALVADLAAVNPRRWLREAAVLAALVGLEVALFLGLQGVRPDLHLAMATPVFWWKSGSLAGIGLLATIAALVSLDPAVTTARRLGAVWRGLGLAVAVALALGWLLDAGMSNSSPLWQRLAWRDGIDCLVTVGLLATPIAAILTLLLRRGATVNPERTAIAAGLAAAGCAAFIFAFCCDHDDPLYVAVWYGVAVVGIAGLTRSVLPNLLRW